MMHILKQRLVFIFTFSYPYIVEKVLFLNQIFKMEILMDLHVLRSPESENHIFSVWSVSLCVCVCACVCLLSAYLRNKLNRNIKFGIQHKYHIQMLLETFHEDRTKTLCTGAHKRILIQ